MSAEQEAEKHGPISPQSQEAEKALICCILSPPHADRAFSLIAERGMGGTEAFLNPAHRIIFAVARELHEKQELVDLVTVTQALRDQDLLTHTGGAAYVTDLFTYSLEGVQIHKAEEHADILLEKHQLRTAITIAERTVRQCYFQQDEASSILAAAAEQFGQIVQVNMRKQPKRLTELWADKMDRLQVGKPDEDLLPTGLSKLDSLSPVKRGDMPLILAAEKVGKSMLAMTIASNMAHTGRAVAYFSLEMTADQQFDRFFHGATRIPIVRDHMDRMGDQDYAAVERFTPRINGMRFDIRDDLYDIASILCAARELKRKWPDLAAIFVDYAQLIRGEKSKGDNREREIGGISRALRTLSLELGCAIFTLSQVNKQDESRESKTLEQDATAIWLLSLVDKEPGKRTLAIPRQRNGESGIGFSVSFLGHISRVEDFKPDAN